MRTSLAVVAGFVLWSVLWVAGHQGAVAAAPQHYDPQGIPLSSALYLGYVVFSVGCSLASGWLAGKLARSGSSAVLVLGVVLILVGIGFQASVWNSEPLWYHLTFLALLLPACLVGGRRAGTRAT